MHILGLGNDLTNIERIAASIERFGDRFLQRVFTEVEIGRCERRPFTRLGSYAKRFAAKEACAKALGTGFRRGVHLRTIGVVNLPSGQPTLALTGGAAERLLEITPPGMVADLHLTLTDDHPWAQAIVMIVARPIHLST